MAANDQNWKKVYVQLAEALLGYSNLDNSGQELVAASLNKEHGRLAGSLSFRMKNIEDEVNALRASK